VSEDSRIVEGPLAAKEEGVALISAVNVFTPATEVQDLERFAGREEELQTLGRALESEGVQIAIYGNRGIGKSSLARLLERMASGDVQVLDRLRARPGVDFDFLTVFFRCDDSVTTIPRLLLRLLSDEDALAPWVPFRVVKREGGDETSGKLDVKVISLGGSTKSSITEAAQEMETDVVSVFNNALRTIRESGAAKSGVLLIIDEVDRIKDRTGLASLLKTLGPQGVTFALVGVATTIQELITEHESVARQLTDGAVLVPPMSEKEMNEIIDRAEALLEHRYRFDPEARAWIARIARGHPFYVHLVGKHSLLKTIDLRQTVVTKQIAEQALREIALKGSAPVQEASYKTAIGHSHTREYVLKAFAEVADDEIHTTELYAGIAKSLGTDVNAISVYVGHLASDKFGAVLARSRERYYRFRDSLFKAYAAARPYQLKPGDDQDDVEVDEPVE